MPIYSYKAYDKQGNVKQGTVEANDEETATHLLEDSNLTVTTMTEEEKKALAINIEDLLPFLKRVSVKEKVIFTRQLSTMINAGLPLIECLNILSEQTKNKFFKEIIEEIAYDVEAGTNLSKSLSKHPGIFPEVFIGMVKAGEASGKLDEVLSKVADQLEGDYNMVSKIKSAMMYPAFILFFMVIIVGILIVFVMPQLKALFEDSGMQLPLPTRILLGLSSFLISYWWLALIILIGIIFGIRYWKHTPSGRKTWDLLKIKTPLIGNITQKIYMARFTRTLGTLLSGGISILEALKITSTTVGNSIYEESIGEIAKKVETGSLIATALKKDNLYPVMVYQMIEVGEKTGTADEILIRLAKFYENEADHLITGLSALIEPIIMVVIGVGVAIIVSAVIVPIYSLVGSF